MAATRKAPKSKTTPSKGKPMKGRAAPEKDPVLFVRITQELDADLDTWLDEVRALHPGFSVSKSDLVRDVLIQALRERRKPSGAGPGP